MMYVVHAVHAFMHVYDYACACGACVVRMFAYVRVFNACMYARMRVCWMSVCM